MTVFLDMVMRSWNDVSKDLESFLPYNEISPEFKFLTEIGPRDSLVYHPYDRQRQKVRSVERVQAFTTPNPNVMLLITDFVPFNKDLLNMETEDILWDKFNREAWFYSQSNSFIPGRSKKVFTCYGGTSCERVDVVEDRDHEYIAVFNTFWNPLEVVFNTHMSNASYLSKESYDLSEGQELLINSLESFEKCFGPRLLGRQVFGEYESLATREVLLSHLTSK